MVSREKIGEFISRAYETSLNHGFHDVERSDVHYLMLVLSEIGEMVEADRKSHRADVAAFKALEEIRIGSDAEYAEYVNKCFVEHVKDTLEDELADVVIRLCDFCGLRRLVPHMTRDGVLEMREEFNSIFGQMSICEQCFSLSSLVVGIARCDDKKENEQDLGMIFTFCFEFARFHGIDLVWHVEQKMRYNESRPSKHGKNY